MVKFNFTQINTLRDLFLRNGVQYDVYDYNSYTLSGLLVQFSNAINLCIEGVDNQNKFLKEFSDWLEKEGLKILVSDKIEELIDNGTLSQIINERLFGELNEKLQNFRIINVLEYGLDSTGNEQKADENDTKMLDVINKLKSDKGGVIYFPTGTYVFRKGFEIDGISSFTLMGGCEKTILKSIGCCDFVSIKNSITGFRMENIYLFNNYTSNCGLKLYNNHHQKISDVRIQGFNGNGLDVEGCFISTFENVFSIENKGIGGNFWSDGQDPSNNNMRILNCNFSKNGEWNLKIDDNYVWHITGLDAEQFDYIQTGDTITKPKGSIYLLRPLMCKIDGLYIETYQRGQTPNFLEEYTTIKIGDKETNRAPQGVTFDNFLISNNSLGKNGLYLDYCRGVTLGVGEIKGCLKGIRNNDVNNTLSISEFTLFTNNSQNVDSEKKLFVRHELTTQNNILNPVGVKGGTLAIHRANQYQRLVSISAYYNKSTNNFASQQVTLKFGGTDKVFNLLPNKTAPFIQKIAIDEYIESGQIVTAVIGEQSQATGEIQFIVEYSDSIR